MNRTTSTAAAMLLGLAIASAAAAADSSAASGSAGSHRIGGGIHYWKTIKNLDDDHSKFDNQGVSYYGSYQYVIGFLKLEGDVEVFPKNYRASDKISIAPQAYALVGGIIYGGLGVGSTWTDDDSLKNKWSDPFMILRAGLDLELLPHLHLDVNGNYQFTKWAKWDEFDTDTITLGAQARLAF